MDRELKRSAGGPFARSQWVLSGHVQGRPENNKAFWTQYLWEHSDTTRVEHGGFTDDYGLAAAMKDTANEMLEKLRADIRKQLETRKDFRLGSVVDVKFKKHPTRGHLAKIEVSREGVPPIVIEDDFAENWGSDELFDKIEDAMMEMAAINPAVDLQPVDDDIDIEHPTTHQLLEVAMLGILQEAFPYLGAEATIATARAICDEVEADVAGKITGLLEWARDQNADMRDARTAVTQDR
jgi:hypothetical protein